MNAFPVICCAVVIALGSPTKASASDAGSNAWLSYSSIPTPASRHGLSFSVDGSLMEMDTDILSHVSYCAQHAEFHCVRFDGPGVRAEEQFFLAVPRRIIGTRQIWSFAGAKFSLVPRREPLPPVSSGASYWTYEIEFMGRRIDAYLVKVESAGKPSRIKSFLYSPVRGVVAMSIDCSPGRRPVCSQLMLAQPQGIFSSAFEMKLAQESQLTTDLPEFVR